MPQFSITDEQRSRLAAVQEDLEQVYVGEYGHVRPEDALEYLLDTYTPPEETSNGTRGDGMTDDGDKASDTAETEATDGSGAEGDTANTMMALLEDHADKWRESENGDARYEVDLPDGSTETARTQSDVRRILFDHYL